jgi:XTP/dITP diphosphohydrolase
MKIVLATHNRHKRQELTTLLRNLEVEILTLEDFPAIGEIEETGETLEENSLIKAQTVHHLTGFPAVADDTGLEVRALNGAPGVRSARYAGEDATYEDNNRLLLQKLSTVPICKRQARFRTVVTFVDGDQVFQAEGITEGRIVDHPRGKRGFGYDPVFLLPELNQTYAELTPAKKNRLSHRGKALKKFVKFYRMNYQMSKVKQRSRLSPQR